MATGDIKQVTPASSNLTITLASLASDSALLAGRQSAEVDNATNLYLDYLLAGKVTTGTSPTDATRIEVWVAALLNDSTYPDAISTGDANRSITSAGIKVAALRLAAVLSVDSTSNRAYAFAPVSVASLFGGVMPDRFVVFVVHNTGAALNSTSGNHVISVTPVHLNIA